MKPQKICWDLEKLVWHRNAEKEWEKSQWS